MLLDSTIKQKNDPKMLKMLAPCLPYLVIFAFSLIMVAGQIKTQSVIVGSDALFHYNRFYETAMQLKTGHFSYFISLFGFEHSARIANALYGPYFAYFQGGLLLLSGNWFTYQVLSRILLGLLAGCSMYRLLRRVELSKLAAVLLSLVFICTFSVQYWTFRQGFSSWGAAILPWALIPAVDLIKTRDFQVLRLAAATALMLQVHVLSTLFLVLVYIPFFVTGFIHSQHKVKLIKKVALAVLISITLSLNILVSLYQVSSKNNLVEPFINHHLYQSTVTANSYQWLLTPFVLVVIMVLSAFWILKRGRGSSLLLKVSAVSCLFFFVLSSSFFPWKQISLLDLTVVNIIQFPFRFFIPTTVLLFLVFALLLVEQANPIPTKRLNVLLVLALSFSFVQVNMGVSQRLTQFLNADQPIKSQKHQFVKGDANQIRQAFFSKNLEDLLQLVVKSTPDYLPTDKNNTQNKYVLYEKYVLGSTVDLTYKQDRDTLTLTWQANEDKEVSLPVVIYHNTKVMLNHQVLSAKDYRLTGIKSLILKQKAGLNQLTLSYRIEPYFYATLGVNLFAWLLVISLSIVKYKRNSTTSHLLNQPEGFK